MAQLPAAGSGCDGSCILTLVSSVLTPEPPYLTGDGRLQRFEVGDERDAVKASAPPGRAVKGHRAKTL